jgi:hypothetical protein
VGLVDDLAPAYMGEDRIRLTLVTLAPQAFSEVEVEVDYAKTLPEFVTKPLELIVRSPSPENFFYRVFARTVPRTITFIAREGGRHLVLVRESAHNLWHGKLVVDVAGDRLH